ncbi:MAG: o-succinylbenzoate synthase [Pirellulales bacterium]
MRIDSIELFHVAMPLIYPWRTAYGEDAAIEGVLARMQSGPLVAWGEAAPFAAPCYSPEWAGGAFACLRDWLAPALVGQQINSGQDLQSRLAHFKGNQFAKAALDTAWWVLESQRQNKPLHRLLGATRDSVAVGADFGVMDSVDQLLTGISCAVDARFPRIKLKFRPGWDLDMLRQVRTRFPDTTFHIDCNSGYRLKDLETFRQVDEFNLAMIEQPLAHDDVVDHAKLQQAIRTPVCLDETITSVERAQQAIELGSCRFVNIKPGRVGGLTVAVAIHNLCQQAGIPCWVGGMLESAIGSRTCVALAMLDNFTYPADIFPSSRFYHQDLAQPELELAPGPDGLPHVFAPNVPGIGAEPRADILERCCRAHARVG